MSWKLGITVVCVALGIGACAKQTAPEASTEQTSSKKAGTPEVKKVEVDGINGWKGFVAGTPARGSKFTRLKIGMSTREVQSLIGYPNNVYSHPTGKAWIPFYFGSGKYETHYLYKGSGRLIFATNAAFTSGMYLVGIEHDANERGFE